MSLCDPTQLNILNTDCFNSDESIATLRALFGYDISASLSGDGTRTTVLSDILYYFNHGMLNGVFYIFAFITIAGVIYTAQDGMFLGRKWSSAWMPVRAILGTLSLFPFGATGICFAQYIMLLFTYIGIGLANYIWYNVTQDIVLHKVSATVPQAPMIELSQKIGQLLIADILQAAMTDAIEQKSKSVPATCQGNGVNTSNCTVSTNSVPGVKSTVLKVRAPNSAVPLLGQGGVLSVSNGESAWKRDFKFPTSLSTTCGNNCDTPVDMSYCNNTDSVASGHFYTLRAKGYNNEAACYPTSQSTVEAFNNANYFTNNVNTYSLSAQPSYVSENYLGQLKPVVRYPMLQGDVVQDVGNQLGYVLADLTYVITTPQLMPTNAPKNTATTLTSCYIGNAGLINQTGEFTNENCAYYGTPNGDYHISARAIDGFRNYLRTQYADQLQNAFEKDQCFKIPVPNPPNHGEISLVPTTGISVCETFTGQSSATFRNLVYGTNAKTPSQPSIDNTINTTGSGADTKPVRPPKPSCAPATEASTYDPSTGLLAAFKRISFPQSQQNDQHNLDSILSSNACGSTDQAYIECLNNDSTTSNTLTTTGGNSAQWVNDNVCQARKDYCNALHFSRGGWFCAGNVYLGLDNSFAEQNKAISVATQVFSLMPVGYNNISTINNGASVYFVESAFHYGVPLLSGKPSGFPFNYGITRLASSSLDVPGVISSLSWTTYLTPQEPPKSEVQDLNKQQSQIAQDLHLQTGAGDSDAPGFSLLEKSILNKRFYCNVRSNRPDASNNQFTGANNERVYDCDPVDYAIGYKMISLLKDTVYAPRNGPTTDLLLSYLFVKQLLNMGAPTPGRYYQIEEVKVLNRNDALFLMNFLQWGINSGLIFVKGSSVAAGAQTTLTTNPMAQGGSVLTTMFQKLLGQGHVLYSGRVWTPGVKVAPAVETGWLQKIYCFGLPDPSACSADKPIRTGASPTPIGGQTAPNVTTKISQIVSHQYSMIQHAQEVGAGLISIVVQSMSAVFTNFKAEVNAIQQKYVSEIEQAVKYGSVASGLAGSLGNLISSAKGYGTIGVAKDSMAMMIAFANLGFQMMWMPIALFVFGSIFTAGVTFSIIVPMIPYILYWSGKVAWILLVIEAMFAAPIMAMAIVYPDGHDIYGQAEPGVKLSVNLLVMPALLVGGLLIGIALTYVVIQFSAIGFHTVSTSILNYTAAHQTVNDSNTIGIIACFMTFVYSTFIAMAFQKCYSAIYVLPEKVLQWIGVQGQKFGEQDAQAITSSAQQSAKEGGQAGGQSTQQGMQSSEQVGKATGEGSAKVGDATLGTVTQTSSQLWGSAERGYNAGAGG